MYVKYQKIKNDISRQNICSWKLDRVVLCGRHRFFHQKVKGSKFFRVQRAKQPFMDVSLYRVPDDKDKIW